MSLSTLVAVAVALLAAPRYGPLRAAEVPALLRAAHVAELGYAPTPARLAMASAQVRLEGLRLCGRNLGAIGATEGEPSCRVGGSKLRAWATYDEAARGLWRLLRAMRSRALHAYDTGDARLVAGLLARCGYMRVSADAYARGLRSFGR